MNILITGGAGFVCSHIADKLNDENHNLILLDNLLTGNKKNIEHLLDNKNVKFIEHDVQDHIEIAEDLDFIFHFAFRNYFIYNIVLVSICINVS